MKNRVGIDNGNPAFAGPPEILAVSSCHQADYLVGFPVENRGAAVSAVDVQIR